MIESAPALRRNLAMDIPEAPRERKRALCIISKQAPLYASPNSAAAKVTQAGVHAESRLGEVVAELGTIPIPAEVMRRSNIRVLQVKGNSMIDDHLWDGDQVIVEHCETVNDGELVVALTRNGDAILGRLRRDGRRIMLEPVDPSNAATFVDEEDVTIRWVVVGILRKYRG
jgi:repressor LexA